MEENTWSLCGEHNVTFPLAYKAHDISEAELVFGAKMIHALTGHIVLGLGPGLKHFLSLVSCIRVGGWWGVGGG